MGKSADKCDSGKSSKKSKKNWNYCNLVIKYLLFLINTVIWLLGIALLALGIYVQVEKTFDMLMLGSVLTNPSIIIIILGGLLFIIGFCGCLGALLELFYLLIIYCILLSLILLVEIGLVVYVFLQQDNAFEAFETLTANAIAHYFEDPDLRDLINLIQSNLLHCCGVRSPGDWESNPYFNCSSEAFQRCSVPFSCCILNEGDVINLQCGYRTLDNTTDRFMVGIHTNGCFIAVQNLVRNNLYVVGGVGIGLLVFQVANTMLAAGLAVDIHKEKKIIKAQKKLKKEQEMAQL